MIIWNLWGCIRRLNLFARITSPQLLARPPYSLPRYSDILRHDAHCHESDPGAGEPDTANTAFMRGGFCLVQWSPTHITWSGPLWRSCATKLLGLLHAPSYIHFIFETKRCCLTVSDLQTCYIERHMFTVDQGRLLRLFGCRR